MKTAELTAADLVRVVGTVHVVVTLLVFPNALTVRTRELIRGTTNCHRAHKDIQSNSQNNIQSNSQNISLTLQPTR